MKDSTAFERYFIVRRNWCKPGVCRRSRGHGVNREYRLLPQLVCRPLRPRGRGASFPFSTYRLDDKEDLKVEAHEVQSADAGGGPGERPEDARMSLSVLAVPGLEAGESWPAECRSPETRCNRAFRLNPGDPPPPGEGEGSGRADRRPRGNRDPRIETPQADRHARACRARG